MNIRDVTYLITLQEKGNYQTAAETLGISKSFLWKTIKNLEKTFGTQLVKRGDKKDSLTETGKLFLDRAFKLQIQFKDVEDEVKRFARGEIYTIKIGIETHILDDRYTNRLNHFRQNAPSVTLKFYEMPPEKIIRGLETKELDAGFVRCNPDEPHFPTLNTELNFRDEYWVALHEKHELASRITVPMEMLFNRPLILPSEQSSSSIRKVITTAFAQKRQIPYIVHETTTTDTAIALVASGQGIAPVFHSTVYYRYPEVKFRKLVRVPVDEAAIFLVRYDDDREILEYFRKHITIFSRRIRTYG